MKVIDVLMWFLIFKLLFSLKCTDEGFYDVFCIREWGHKIHTNRIPPTTISITHLAFYIVLLHLS